MKIAYGKKKVNFKTLVIAYRNELGEKVEIGKYTPNDTIPPFSMTTFAIILHFEFPKSKKPNVSCGICSNNN